MTNKVIVPPPPDLPGYYSTKPPRDRITDAGSEHYGGDSRFGLVTRIIFTVALVGAIVFLGTINSIIALGAIAVFSVVIGLMWYVDRL